MALESVLHFDSESSLRIALEKIVIEGKGINGSNSEEETQPCPDSDSDSDSDAGNCDWIINNLENENSKVQNVADELARLEVLKSYMILNSDPEVSYDHLTSLASRIFDVPVALVSLVDVGRQWFKSNRGFGDTREISRKRAFCSYAISSSEDVFIVNDAIIDNRFKENCLVTGPPHVRFYAGAPLTCPEGYKLGTFCIIDFKPRPNGLTLTEKQNLIEFANLSMDFMVRGKEEHERIFEQKSKLIACAAHDLLTPLTGLQLNLNLLVDDENFRSKIDDEQYLESIQSAVRCSNVMSDICHSAIGSFRADVECEWKKMTSSTSEGEGIAKVEQQRRESTVDISLLVKNLNHVMESYPKSVSLSFEVAENVPSFIISDDLKIFRSALNFLTNSCKFTEVGFIKLVIHVAKKTSCEIDRQTDDATKPDMLFFECIDTGPGISTEKRPNLFKPFHMVGNGMNKDLSGVDHSHSGLGLYSMATCIESLGGNYGYCPRDSNTSSEVKENSLSERRKSETSLSSSVDSYFDFDNSDTAGSVFWFSIPIILPEEEGASQRPRQRTLQNPSHTKCSFRCNDSRCVSCDELMLVKKEECAAASAESHDPSFRKPVEKRNGRTNPPSLSKADSDEKKVERNVAPISSLNQVTNTTGREDAAIKEKNVSKERLKRALVIDDSLIIRKTLDRALSRLGFEVKLAVDGMEGLQEMVKDSFDIVLCDFLMPVMDGLDCVQKYREWESSHRSWFRQFIVGMSAHASENDGNRGIEVGMDLFMTKPTKLDSLKKVTTSDRALECSRKLEGRFQNSLDGKNEAKVVDTESLEGDLLFPNSGNTSSSSSKSACLIAVGKSKSIEMTLKSCVESRGWYAHMAKDGEETLRQLKMRNWDAVFIDDETPLLSGVECVSQFRDWEKENRIVTQKNIYMMGGLDGNAVLPNSFDGLLKKPVNLKKIVNILDKIGNGDRNNSFSQVLCR